MPNNYSALNVYDLKEVCENCLCKYKQYSMTWNNKTVKCVVNDNRSVVFYTKHGQPMRLLYKDIKRVELRPCMKLVFILHNSEIVVSGFKRKSMFNHLKRCLENQLLVIG